MTEIWLDQVFWLPSYGDCFYCSTKNDIKPATYEMWFEVTGRWVEGGIPQTVGHTTCDNCTLEVRLEVLKDPDPEMKLVRIRDLR